jgi:hypothetical protein
MIHDAVNRGNLSSAGISIHTHPPSQVQRYPFQPSGPRFYISMNNAVVNQLRSTAIPAVPTALVTCIFGAEFANSCK